MALATNPIVYKSVSYVPAASSEYIVNAENLTAVWAVEAAFSIS
jgi:hypothetical protein